MTEAGCDEAGRGCYAGPVFAAAVVLPKRFYHPLLNDSKQVSESDRNELRVIIESKAIAWSVARVDQDEIDRINILNASFKAMHLALDSLSMRPGLLLIDGNRFTPYQEVPHHCIIKGDGLYASIAAASILAKTWRDEYMQQLHLEFPHYRWDSNKGYGTAAHRNAIEKFGLCKYHRKSFNIWDGAADEEDGNYSEEYGFDPDPVPGSTDLVPRSSESVPESANFVSHSHDPFSDPPQAV